MKIQQHAILINFNIFSLLSTQGLNRSEDRADTLFTLHDIQSLDWLLPETRILLEKQFKNEMNKSKKRNIKHQINSPGTCKK